MAINFFNLPDGVQFVLPCKLKLCNYWFIWMKFSFNFEFELSIAKLFA